MMVSCCLRLTGDLQFLPDLAAYMNNTGAAADGRHNPIPNIIWWSWNDNSGACQTCQHV